MADDNTSYRSYDSNRRAAEPSRLNGEGDDPLAELARLIGRSESLAEFGRSNNSRPAQQAAASAPTLAPDTWQYPSADEERFASFDSRGGDGYGSNRDSVHPPARAVGGLRVESHPYDNVHFADDPQGDEGERQDHAAEYYFQDDVSPEPHEQDMYDDPPRARHRGGLATALALIGCAMLGTAGAYAYRSFYGHAGATQPPPIITADSSTPSKIVPAAPADPQSSKTVQDRVADAGKEQLVSKQEEPVPLKERGTQAAPRVVLPAPVVPAPPPAAAQPAGAPSSGSNEPKKVRTVTIRPDGSDVSARPVGTPGAPDAVPSGTAAGSRPATTPPAPRAGASATRASPLSLEPQAGEPAASRARTAAAPAPSRSAPEATGTLGGFVVQLSSQKSEGEAQSSFRSLQAKFPNELGGRQPIIRRVDLGSKGVFYRTMIGPFASAHDASQFCASYKAAGGQCVVPNN